MKKTLIRFDSSALGDTIAWMPYTEEYRIKHDLTEIYVNCNFSEIFDYPLTIFNSDDSIESFDEVIEIGISIEDDYNDITYPDFVPLQQYASEKLGFRQFIERKPRMLVKRSYNPILYDKVASIGIHSTAQAKYWNNSEGWQDVVDFLSSNGYDVYCLDRYRVFGNENLNMWNEIPESVIFEENIDLDEIMSLLEVSHFFVGVSGGLSWLAWALDIPVVMISGFTDPINEFKQGNYRIHNKKTCNSCWHKSRFDGGKWDWCPEIHFKEEKFECTKSISSDIVIEKIVDCVSTLVKSSNSRFDFPFLKSWDRDRNQVNLFNIYGIGRNRIVELEKRLDVRMYDITTNILWESMDNVIPGNSLWFIPLNPLGVHFIQEGLRLEVWEYFKDDIDNRKKLFEKVLPLETIYRYHSIKSFTSFNGDKLIFSYPEYNGNLMNRVREQIKDDFIEQTRYSWQHHTNTANFPMEGDVVVDFAAGVGISSLWFNRFSPKKVFLFENDNFMRKYLVNNISLFNCSKYQVVDYSDLFSIDKIDYLSCTNSDILENDFLRGKFLDLAENSKTVYIKTKLDLELFPAGFSWCTFENYNYLMRR